jgi:hypothetical protein
MYLALLLVTEGLFGEENFGGKRYIRIFSEWICDCAHSGRISDFLQSRCPCGI